uniref:glucuronosyltransferase n=1 Tax=Globodera rostochiensis TaxID=31243 RepID=A0A914IF16_GLORO
MQRMRNAKKFEQKCNDCCLGSTASGACTSDHQSIYYTWGIEERSPRISAGIPLIVMPVTAEQAHNAHVLLKMRIARAVINKFYITETNLFNTINSVLSRSDELLARAKKVLEIFLDRPIPAMDEAIFVVEHRIFDNNGTGWARYTQRKGMLLGWTEFAYLDLIATIFVCLIIINW